MRRFAVAALSKDPAAIADDIMAMTVTEQRRSRIRTGLRLRIEAADQFPR
jgi:hypothetical protein